LGRKIEQDYVSQALQVALAIKRPVKLTWMREEDFAHDQYRPMALIQLKAGLDASKNIVAWSYRTVSQSILAQRGWLPPGTVDSQAVEGAVKLPYGRGACVTEWVPLAAGIPVGFWRSVGSSINTFAVESMIDMLAKAAGMDPFAFRYQVLTDIRARGVLAAADQASAWRKTLPAGRAWGMALAESFGTVVCEVFEISQPAAGSLRVHRVLCVVDCGIAVNPDSVEAQMQGGIVHGLSAALWGQVTFTQGVANQTNFNKYRSLRLSEMPDVTVKILPNQNPPTGVGEPGVPPVAPALANAYARLTGVRVTTLPFFPGATMSGL
jgi:isoquinoline 1-oxidoreductase beta subunit